MNHFISLAKAKQMTALYRQQKENILDPSFRGKNILSICETFDVAPFLKVLAEPDCVSLRVYYGMSDDLKIHAIVVGVNSSNGDILPASNPESLNLEVADDDDDDTGIIEEALRCPPACPPESPLNT